MRIKHARFLAVGKLAAAPAWRIKAHAHSFHEMIVIVRGLEHLTIRGDTIAAPTGTGLFYPAGVRHEEWADAQRPFTSLFVSFAWPGYPPTLPRHARDFNGRIRQLIAPQCGLGNEYHLSRLFRRHFDLPPGAWRRSH